MSSRSSSRISALKADPPVIAGRGCVSFFFFQLVLLRAVFLSIWFGSDTLRLSFLLFFISNASLSRRVVPFFVDLIGRAGFALV